jgi:cytochrome b
LVLAPARVSEYAGSLLRGQPVHYTGHNPLGSIAILLLLALILATGISGVITYEDWGSFRHMDRYHEWAANILLWMVGIHLAGVFVSSFLHRENLVWGMVSGSKQGDTTEAVDLARGRVAVWLLIALIVLAATLS